MLKFEHLMSLGLRVQYEYMVYDSCLSISMLQEYM
jgi:hypothetical protein